MNSTTALPHLRIWQQNLNKSLIAQQHLLNSAQPNDWDILLLQEPWFGKTVTRASHRWRVLYPDSHYRDEPATPRLIIFVNTNLTTEHYEQIQFQSADITGISIKTSTTTLVILNVYNDCNHNAALDEITNFLSLRYPDDHIPDNQHIIIAGDFNRHHEWWESEDNSHLKSSETMVQPLLDIINRFDLRMALPPKIPTLQALSTGNWTRLDNVWCTTHTSALFTQCDTNPALRGPNTDHVPILSKLELPLNHNVPKPTRNFRATDWVVFNECLTTLLPPPTPETFTFKG